MPTFINPFRGVDPVSQSISDLGTALFANGGQKALTKEQILKAQRENTETTNFGKLIQQLGTAGALADPTGQAELFSSGYTPKDAADLALAGTANADGATAQSTQNAQVGAGQSYDNTAGAVNNKLAETAREFDQTPQNVMTATGPTILPRERSFGLAPVLSDSDVKGVQLQQNWSNLGDLSDTQQRALGVAPKASMTPHNYVAPDGRSFITYDGITDAGTGQRLQPGGFIANAQGSADQVGLTSSTKTNLQSSVMSANQFHGLAQSMIDLTQTHPEAFGIYGKAAGGVQEVLQSADVLINQLGGEKAFNDLLNNAQNTLQASGASPDVLAKYNPAIPVVDSLGPVLAYQAAATVAGQTGRSVSDKDVELWTNIVGDPQGWLSSAPQVATKLKLLDATVTYAQQINQQFLSEGVKPESIDSAQVFSQAYQKAVADTANGGQPLTAPAGPPTTGAPPPAAPAAPADIPEGTTATNPTTHQRIVLRGGQWVPM